MLSNLNWQDHELWKAIERQSENHSSYDTSSLELKNFSAESTKVAVQVIKVVSSKHELQRIDTPVDRRTQFTC